MTPIIVSKAKIDFRKPTSLPPTVIKGAEVAMVDSYKYLGVILDNKPCFERRVDRWVKRKVRTFHVSSEMMSLFHRKFIESVLTFRMAAWFGKKTLMWFIFDLISTSTR